MEMQILILFIACLSGFVGAWIVAVKGVSLGFIDQPKERSSHSKPVPKGGGIGILVAFITLSVFFDIPLTLWLPASLLSLVSLAGDSFDISYKVRLMVQSVVAITILLNASHYSFPIQLQQPWLLLSEILVYFLLVVFIVGTLNFYNFMDGIDGIAGITGCIAFALIALIVFHEKKMPEYGYLSLGLVFSSVGFLCWNFPKARVFMGDVSSILLGLLFASIVVLLSESYADFFCFVGFLFPFYADELVTIWDRIRRKESLLVPHRTHLYQVLANEYGVSHWKVSIGYGTVQILISVILISLKPFGARILFLFLAVSFFAFFGISKWIKSKID